ncbi:MAG: thiamine pyrophosphate-dependent dehydrogenase E1 component subunit alpha [Streptosporangiaceae bacterium]
MSGLTAVDRFRWMARIRAFERACLEGVPTREIHGELHTAIGQEAIAAGLAGWLRDDDALVSTHRNHGHALIKGVEPRALLAEIFERRTGLCGGFGGHMHPFDPGRRFSASGIVGASLPVALGHAYAAALEGRDGVAVAITGDGGANHGTFHECMNMASAWRLPLIVVIENNGLAISVPADAVGVTETLADRAEAYECIGVTVDGTDAEAVSAAFGELVRTTRAAPAPSVFEATCARFQGHYEGDAQVYRAGQQDFTARDPLLIARRNLVASGLPAEQLDSIEQAAAAEFSELLAAVREDPPPAPGDALRHVFAEEGQAV